MTNARYCLRNDLALVHVSGADARQFLHAQTTQSITDLDQGGVRPAAWLTPRGRVQALFDVAADGESFWLLTHADNASWLVERMRLFVLRSDVGIEVASGLVVYSLWGDLTRWLATQSIDLRSGAVTRRDEVLWLRIDETLAHVIVRGNADPALFADAEADTEEHARAVEIAAGRPDLPPALRDRYVPQMLNLDRLGAISFTKGCYPGQEIVARTQNLGQVKRRLGRFGIADGERPIVGSEIVDDNSRPAGEVVRVVDGHGGYELLAVVRVDTAGSSLTLASDGRPLNGLDPSRHG